MKLFAILATAALYACPAVSLIIDSLPSCWQSCALSTDGYNCNAWDVNCQCRAAQGNFLPDAVACIRTNCNWNLDASVWISPLQLACSIAGIPVPAAAVSSALYVATATAWVPKPTTVAPYVAPTVTTGWYTQVITQTYATTVTQIRTDQGGSTVYVVQPLTIAPTTVYYGQPSTLTQRVTVQVTTTVPVVVQTTPTTTYSSYSPTAYAITSSITTTVPAVWTTALGSLTTTWVPTVVPVVTTVHPSQTTAAGNGGIGGQQPASSPLALGQASRYDLRSAWTVVSFVMLLLLL